MSEAKLHVKKGDKVMVLSGKDKGKTGAVIQAIPKKGKAVVEGINKIKQGSEVKPEPMTEAELNTAVTSDESKNN